LPLFPFLEMGLSLRTFPSGFFYHFITRSPISNPLFFSLLSVTDLPPRRDEFLLNPFALLQLLPPGFSVSPYPG